MLCVLIIKYIFFTIVIRYIAYIVYIVLITLITLITQYCFFIIPFFTIVIRYIAYIVYIILITLITLIGVLNARNGCVHNEVGRGVFLYILTMPKKTKRQKKG